ncbi:hypothetical protein MMB17_07330 [Methylobacterium organophilum]|uniref:hypothetical protein n=1 Tax=Methylobacterium organophilum TaxID=410 RepID=UPI001F1404A0|nr:hypothetical protein [Methylobacterium organophilum]UMY19101.1 hypothetical protein MMB17_07330 [Methylobacterium organophilum]
MTETSQPAAADLAISDAVLELWFGGFDTAVISEVLTQEGSEISEPEVVRIITAEQDRRYAARSASRAAGASR